MQYPLTKTVFVVIQIITQYYRVYCENSFSPKYAHLWLFIADLLFIGGALGATIKFFQRLKTEIDHVHRGPAKVYSFIGIVAFQIIQGVRVPSSVFQLPQDTDRWTDHIPPAERQAL